MHIAYETSCTTIFFLSDFLLSFNPPPLLSYRNNPTNSISL